MSGNQEIIGPDRPSALLQVSSCLGITGRGSLHPDVGDEPLYCRSILQAAPRDGDEPHQVRQL
jgi:hypothetical protein